MSNEHLLIFVSVNKNMLHVGSECIDLTFNVKSVYVESNINKH